MTLAHETKPVRTKLPLAVVALGFASFFTDVASEMIFPLLPAFLATLGAGPVFLGLIEGVADAVASFLKLASGYAAERATRRKPLVLFGYGIASLARPLVAFASAPWHVLLVRVTDRVGKGVRTSPRDVLLAAAAPRGEAGRAFGFHRSMDHAGAVVGPLLATFLLSLGMPLRHVFLAAIVPSALSMLAVLAVREPERTLAAPSAAVSGDKRERLPRSLTSFLAILLVFALGNSSDVFLLVRATELGVPIELTPILWSVFHVSKVVSAYYGGRLADRVPRARVIASGWGVYALTYLGLGYVGSATSVWLLFVVYGAYYGLTEPAEKALVRDLAPEALRGRAFGYYNFVLGVSAIPAGLLMGYLWQTFGARTALSCGAALAVVSALALLAWSRRYSYSSASATTSAAARRAG